MNQDLSKKVALVTGASRGLGAAIAKKLAACGARVGVNYFGSPEFCNYASAKGAQLVLTRSWANELAPWQITVNLTAPGWIPTERHIDDPQAMKDAYAAAVPMKHMGAPEDVGEAVAFLASDGA